MEEAYCLQEELLEEESEDEFTYDKVVVDEELISSGDEDLSTARQHNAHTIIDQTAESAPASLESVPIQHPEVVEDFVRNYLLSNGMLATAESFQQEWYRLAQTNQLREHETTTLPDAYTQNSRLEAALKESEDQVISYKEAARLCKEKYVRLQKERDYHRMHHRRLVQEKNKLVADIKRLRKHFSQYEPLLQELRQKYQSVTKEKMMACLERDRAISEVGCLQSTLQSVQKTVTPNKPQPSLNQHTIISSQETKKKRDYEFPQPPSNPSHTSQLPVCAQFTRTGGLQPAKSYTAHEFAVGSVTIHPSKQLAVTGSDDHSWKMWTIPSGDLILSGEGHTDWISDVAFHSSGTLLATSSGDGTVKVWDFERSKCSQTFTEHQQPVWSCSWHWAGVCLASGGMDHTVKLWDANNGVCMQTLRGHADSVNKVAFIPHSNILATGSADKTLSLWDARTGLCVQTYYGHQHSCNSVVPNKQSTQLYSCDCFGSVIHWDIRTHSIIGGWELGPYAINELTVDPAGTLLACASADGSIRLVDTSSNKEWCLEEHKDSVLSVQISSEADILVSTDNSGTLVVWQ